MKIEGGLKNRVKVIPEIKVDKRGQKQIDQKFGSGEMLYLSFDPAVPKGEWKIVAGTGDLVPHAAGEAQYFCPATSQHVKLECSALTKAYREVLATVEFDVIAPTFRFVKYYPFHYASTDPNAGFLAAFIMTPDTVSFARVALRECGGNNEWTKVKDDSDQLNSIMTTPIAGRKHTDGNSEGWAWYIKMGAGGIVAPAGKFSAYVSQVAKSKDPSGNPDWDGKDLIRTIGGVSGTVNFRDNVYNPIMTNPPPWVGAADLHHGDVYAEYYLDIPVHYALVGKNNAIPAAVAVGTRLAVNRHSFRVLKDGTLTVRKGPAAKPESVKYALADGAEGVADKDRK